MLNIRSEDITARARLLLQQHLSATAQDPNYKLRNRHDITACLSPPEQLLAPLPRHFALLFCAGFHTT